MGWVPTEMAEPCLAQAQGIRSRTYQLRSQLAQIRFVTHKQTRALQALNQGPWIPSRLKTTDELKLRSQTTFHRQLSCFTRSAIRTAVQAVGDQSEIAQTAAHLECALDSQRRQTTIWMIHALVALNRDAVTQQQQVNQIAAERGVVSG